MADLKEAIDFLHDHYAVTFPPIDPRLAQQASVRLVKMGLPPIPMDYTTFLSATNGLSWNGVELFSLNNVARNKGAFFHPGILENAAFCQRNALMAKKLWLGLGVELMLVYDATQRLYMLLDRYTFQPVRTFVGIADFLSDIAKSVQKSTADTTEG